MDFLTSAYMASGIIMGLAFATQILRLAQNLDHAHSISISSWGMFAGCSAITTLYSIHNNGDTYFIFCSALCLLGNLGVLGLAIFGRMRFPKAPHVIA